MRSLEFGEIGFASGNRVGHAAGEVLVAEEEIGEGAPTLDAGVPAHDDGRRIVDPFVHEDGARGRDDDDAVRVLRCDGLDEGDVVLRESQARTVAPDLLAPLRGLEAFEHLGEDGAFAVVHGLGVEAHEVVACVDATVHPFALLPGRVADDEHRGVRDFGESGCPVEVGGIVDEDFGVGERFAQSRGGGDRPVGVDVRGAAVPEVDEVGDAPEDGDPAEGVPVEREHRRFGAFEGAVAEEDHGFGCRPTGERSVLRRGDDGSLGGLGVSLRIELELGSDDAFGGAPDRCAGRSTVLEGAGEVLLAELGEGRLEVESRLERCGGGSVARRRRLSGGSIGIGRACH